VLDQYLTRPKEKPEEKVAEHKATFLDALKRLQEPESTHDKNTKNIIVMCNKVENELHRLTQDEKKQKSEKIV
jgi:ribosome-binding ATPase YchF (GTP1/OBG family)